MSKLHYHPGVELGGRIHATNVGSTPTHKTTGDSYGSIEVTNRVEDVDCKVCLRKLAASARSAS